MQLGNAVAVALLEGVGAVRECSACSPVLLEGVGPVKECSSRGPVRRGVVHLLSTGHACQMLGCLPFTATHVPVARTGSSAEVLLFIFFC